MTFRKKLIARKHRKMAAKIEAKLKLSKAASLPAAHIAAKAKVA